MLKTTGFELGSSLPDQEAYAHHFMGLKAAELTRTAGVFRQRSLAYRPRIAASNRRHA
jgi:hypothetical protein